MKLSVIIMGKIKNHHLDMENRLWDTKQVHILYRAPSTSGNTEDFSMQNTRHVNQSIAFVNLLTATSPPTNISSECSIR